MAHLGNGCSAAAISGGKSVDTTMGLTPMEGLVMGTRSGDVDPGLLGYLAERTGQSAADLTDELDTRSGLLGLSGTSNDMRTITESAEQGDERARLALDVFVHRLAKAVAGLAASLDGLDALVFTAGIGEHSPVVRSRVLARLGFLGLTEDPAANAAHGRATDGRISRPGPVQALVVPTDEELMIARDTARLVTTPRLTHPTHAPSAPTARSSRPPTVSSPSLTVLILRPGPAAVFLRRRLPPPGRPRPDGLGPQPPTAGSKRLRGPPETSAPSRLESQRPPLAVVDNVAIQPDRRRTPASMSVGSGPPGRQPRRRRSACPPRLPAPVPHILPSGTAGPSPGTSPAGTGSSSKPYPPPQRPARVHLRNRPRHSRPASHRPRKPPAIVAGRHPAAEQPAGVCTPSATGAVKAVTGGAVIRGAG